MKNPLNVLTFNQQEETHDILLPPTLKNLFEDEKVLKITCFTFFVSVLMYWFELTNFTLSYDEEIHMYSASGTWKWWISEERWAMAAFDWIMPRGFGATPFLATAIFCVGLTLSAVIIAEAVDADSRWKYFFVSLFVSCPIFCFIGEFSQHAPGVVVGLLLATIAARNMFMGFRKKYFIWATILTTVAIGFYQSLVFYFFTVSLLILIRQRHKSQFSLYAICPPCAVVLLSVFLHYCTVHMSQKLFHISRTEYLNGFISVNDMLPSFGRMFNRMLALLGGYSPIFLELGTASMLICWTGVVIAILSFIKQWHSPSWVNVVFFTLSFLSAVAFIFLTPNIHLPYRALFALCPLYAFVGAWASALISHKIFIHSIVVISIFANIHISTSLFNADHIARMRDQVMATMLFSRMTEVAPKLGIEKTKFTIIGAHLHEREGEIKNLDFIGLSFFSDWNKMRVVHYFKFLGIKKLHFVPGNSVFKTSDETIAYPSWPDNGSVFLKDDVIVIKLSEITHGEKRFFKK